MCSVYYGVEGDVELVDGDRSVTISSNEEWKDIIIWNPYGEEKMGYKNFVCIENGRISDVVVLPPQGVCSLLVPLVRESRVYIYVCIVICLCELVPEYTHKGGEEGREVCVHEKSQHVWRTQ